MANEWYRKTTWTKEDEEDFFAHLKRARDSGRRQYLRIQAQILYDQNIDALTDTALMLLERFFETYVENSLDKCDKTSALLLLAQIYNRKRIFDKALEYYEKAADFEKEYPNVHCGAKKAFSRFVLVHGLKDLFDKAENYTRTDYDHLQDGGAFPYERYAANTLLAIFERRKGDSEKSLHYKKIADEAAEAAQSGFTYHQGLGLVSERDSELEKLLEEDNK